MHNKTIDHRHVMFDFTVLDLATTRFCLVSSPMRVGKRWCLKARYQDFIPCTIVLVVPSLASAWRVYRFIAAGRENLPAGVKFE